MAGERNELYAGRALDLDGVSSWCSPIGVTRIPDTEMTDESALLSGLWAATAHQVRGGAT